MTGGAGGDWDSPARATWAAIVLVAIGAIFRFLLAWNRAFQVDEVEHIHAAYNISRGLIPYRDFIQGHTPLLYSLLLPLIRPDDPVWTFLASRMLMFAATIVAILFSFLLARRLFGPAAGVATAILLSFNTTFAERGVEVRPDIWLGVMSVTALWLELRPGSRVRDSVGAALAAALAVLFTQKALFLCVALGGVWIAKAIRDRRASRIFAPAAAFPVPLLLSFLPFLAGGGAREYLTWAFLHPFGVFAGQQPTAYVERFSPVLWIQVEALRNRLFDVLVVAGLVVMMVAALRTRELRFEKMALALCAGFFIASLWFNPYPYPYVHAGILPVAAVAAGVAAASAVRTLRPWPAAALLLSGAILVGATYKALPRMAEKATPAVRNYQFALLEEVQTITRPDEAVLDLAGLYFRPDSAWTYFMTVVMSKRYEAGVYPRLIPQWEKTQPVAILWSYRMAILPKEELAYLRERFTHYRGNVLVLGRGIAGGAGETQAFPVLRTRRFRWDGPPGALAVDGRRFDAGVLSRGDHVLTLRAPARGTLLMDPPGRSYLAEAPWKGYFAAFD